jgi:hypothetical protein
MASKEKADSTIKKTPLQLSAEEERALLDKLKAETDLVALESECRELLRQRERGELFSFEQVVQDLFGLEEEDKEQLA